MTKGPSKRQIEADARKRAILSTEAFRVWWTARQDIAPIPSDPYRAFMIDKGLNAGHFSKEEWEQRANRADLFPIDLPGNAPAFKPRDRPIKNRNRRDHPPTQVHEQEHLNPLEKDVHSLIDKMAEKYHVSKPRIIFVRNRGTNIGAYSSGITGITEPYIRLGMSGGENFRAQALSTAAHEMGHHIHTYSGAIDVRTGRSTDFLTSSTVDRERKAWSFAKPFMTHKKAVQNWDKRFAIGTYLRNAGPGKRGVNWDPGFKPTEHQSQKIRKAPLRKKKPFGVFNRMISG